MTATITVTAIGPRTVPVPERWPGVLRADLRVHVLDDDIDDPNCCRPEHASPPASMASR